MTDDKMQEYTLLTFCPNCLMLIPEFYTIQIAILLYQEMRTAHGQKSVAFRKANACNKLE